MNILLSSLGLNTIIIEEALGVFNYSGFDFYNGHPNHNIVSELRQKHNLSGDAIDEVWLIATDKKHSVDGMGRNSTLEDYEELESKEKLYGVKFRMFLLADIEDISSAINAQTFRDLTLRVVAYAQQMKHDGKVFVSLACGRKTMSTDIQEAVYCFGCDELIHVLGNNADDACPIFLGKVLRNDAINLGPVTFPDEDLIKDAGSTSTLSLVEEQKSKAQHFYTTFYLNQQSKNNFHILYTLPPSKIHELQHEFIGEKPENEYSDLEYLQRLPKTELHCHLGGVLNPTEMVEVAKCYISLIEAERQRNKAYSQWCDDIDSMLCSMDHFPSNWKDWYNSHATLLNVHKGLIVAPILLSFEGRTSELEKLVYGGYIDEKKYVGVGIDRYEQLGDFQGSALLCNENALRKTVQILLENCKKENVLYLEVRCSPINYVNNNLDAERILNVIFEELEKEQDSIESSVIIIASRHNNEKKIKDSIALMERMTGQPLFDKYFRGFDLAGAEDAAEAENFRKVFLDVMKNCHNITIHAGETVPSESIWQAVYHLNAERIGHGLTLTENKDLMNKFLERGIGIEMCPASNYQIVGFKDNYFKKEQTDRKIYPLKLYLDMELKVSINTDDPGISRTNITKEYLKAGRLTEGGLSKWDILQLICNGFRTAFYPYKKKQELIYKAEQYLAELIKQDKI